MGAQALKGTIDRYISPPREEGFAVLSVSLPGGTRARICGKGLAGLAAGQSFEATGQWTTHQKWGKQFRTADLHVVIPDVGAGLRRWLVDIAGDVIDAATADRLVDALGDDTVGCIATADDRARAILGADLPEAQRIMVRHKAEAAFGPQLAASKIDRETRERIFERYGLQTARQISEDPYLLVDIEGISYADADRIANATGLRQIGRSRLVAAAIDALRTAAGDGHTAVDNATLARMVATRTGATGPIVDALLEDLDHPQAIATTILGKDDQVLDGWSLRALHDAEEIIAVNILDKLDEPSLITTSDARAYVAEAQRRLEVELNEEQEAGAIMALANSFSVLTGGPGTGKTTTLRVITCAWSLAAGDGWVREDIRQGAPTGKAAMRMKESTRIDATTVHRLLEVDPETRGFVRDEATPIEAGFICIDESSMKDVHLAAAFTRAWGDANVLLLGDPDQLSSVGPGRFLGDLIDSGVVPVTHLVQVRRQAEDSAIAQGAKAIREGRMPTMEAGSDFMFIDCDDEERIAGIVSELHAAFVEDGMDVQTLTPSHNGPAGTVALNARLQEDAALEGEAVGIGKGLKVRVGDKVIQSVNDNEIELYNGDAGRVSRVDAQGAVVRIGDRDVPLVGDALAKLALAYALTIHKSQGSEYEVVLMPVSPGHRRMLRRSLIYTGLTRAKKMCIVVGSRRDFEKAIAADDGKARTTTLAQRLRVMAGVY